MMDSSRPRCGSIAGAVIVGPKFDLLVIGVRKFDLFECCGLEPIPCGRRFYALVVGVGKKIGLTHEVKGRFDRSRNEILRTEDIVDGSLI